MKVKAAIKRLHNTIILDCIRSGVIEPEEIRNLSEKATKRISKMTVAGVKAALTKRQRVY